MQGAVTDNNGNIPQVWKWMADGEVWLKQRFQDYPHIAFMGNVDKKHITLQVFRRNGTLDKLECLFTVREKAETFPSNLLVTKITMVL